MSLTDFSAKNKQLELFEVKFLPNLLYQVGCFEERAQVFRINKALKRYNFSFHCLCMHQSLLTNLDDYIVY